MRFVGRVSLGALGAVLLAGCFDVGGGGCDFSSANGLAGNGTFTYECTSQADAYCDGSTTGQATAALPTAIARGARFRVRFDGGGLATPVSSKAVSTRNGDFIALTTGPLGFVVLAPSGPDAVDAIRLTAVEADGLAIDGAGDETGFFGRWSAPRNVTQARFVVNVPGRLRATATSAGLPVAGSLSDVTWSVDPPDIATLSTSDDGLANVTPNHVGVAKFTAIRGGATADAYVQIIAYNKDPEDGGAVDSGLDGATDLDASDASDAGGDQ